MRHKVVALLEDLRNGDCTRLRMPVRLRGHTHPVLDCQERGLPHDQQCISCRADELLEQIAKHKRKRVRQ